MSLELALERNTAALEKQSAIFGELIALLRQPSETVTVEAFTISPGDVAIAKEKAKRLSKKEVLQAAPVGEPVEEATAPSTEPTATDAPATEAAAAPTRQLEYADVSEATLRLVKVKGTKHVKDMLAQHGYGTAKDIPMDMWPAWIAACNAETEIPF